jgi:hypothetical protein
VLEFRGCELFYWSLWKAEKCGHYKNLKRSPKFSSSKISIKSEECTMKIGNTIFDIISAFDNRFFQ